MVDKNYCMSSYLAFRYVQAEDKDFFEGLHHKNIAPIAAAEKVYVKTAEEIDVAIQNAFETQRGEKLGLMLSGGMDSAILAAYMPKGADAYTFRFLGGEFQREELQRAEYYAQYYGLNLHYVDIGWEDVEKYLPIVMKAKCAPVHPIEPQLYKAAMQAKRDGITKLVLGECADQNFGGLDGLLAKDWQFDEFVKRYYFTDPAKVLVDPVDMRYLFEPYRRDGDKIDFLHFIEDVFAIEGRGIYHNAFGIADMPYFFPYAAMRMAVPLDLQRVRNGESKYLIRELFEMKYHMKAPNKIPMPRPVDAYFADWKGPTRPEFKSDLNMSEFTGNQKWQMYCLEQFLNMYD